MIGLTARELIEMPRPVVAYVFLMFFVAVFAVYFGYQRFLYEDTRPGPQIKGSHFQLQRLNHDRFRQRHSNKDVSTYARQRLIEDSFVKQGRKPSPAIILLTYMRSGSSMTGDILQRHKDTFYVFEPIWGIREAEENGRNITFLNGTVRQPGTYNKTELYMTDLKGWLTCDLRLITLNSIFAFFMNYGKKTQPAWECLQDHSKPRLLCLSYLNRECEVSKTRIVKTLRISMKMAEEILKDIPGSKVIHLVRDPRATLQSKKVLMPPCLKSFTGNPGCIKDHCDAVRSNTRSLNRFESGLRSRVLTVRYEDIVNEPMQNTKRLYRFIGLDDSRDIKQFAYNITIGGKIKDCKICNLGWQAGRDSGSSSLSHIAAWKKSLTLAEVVEIQSRCRDTLRYYGYKLYDVDD